MLNEHGFADLHVHTTASDGMDTLSERCVHAKEANLPVFAVTDHDCLHPAFSEPIMKTDHCAIISGAEIRAGVAGHEVEILGLFLNPTSTELRDVLERVQQHRIDRNQAIVRALRTHAGLETTYETLINRVDGVLTRPHLAEQLKREDIVESHDAAFQQYLKSGVKTHEPLQLVECEEVISAIHDAGGVASLAHPGYFQPPESDRTVDSLASLIQRLQTAGLDAIEVMYEYGESGFSAPRAAALASDIGLLQTGGSDCHGSKNSITTIGDVRVSRPEFQRLYQRADTAISPY
ncbi:PHP domain-containing protein [Haloquadratum walsbyi]|uniref:Putative metal-dependent phosphoesterases (PHP family) n=1 Tax=Haloquadratum walsbyi J07HQW2 TaxID=1238425 RepID=U1PXC4_9EURY|nr:PHP domain-containing protein [Haloquadratum walsbyi]ERG97106.1 MAG: putative metal-dependent phosphoesterases (PHP family) [Haloquadratum walsbyi J07HQW2]